MMRLWHVNQCRSVQVHYGSACMMCMSSFRRSLIAAAFLAFVPASHAQTSPLTPDIPAKYEAPTDTYDYVKRDIMIPMRDGVRLHTVIVIPRGANNAPMILTRTPYNASKRAERAQSPHMLATLPQGEEIFVADRYICVFQDVRGKYGSEGDYLMTRPLRGPLNSTGTDNSTDAYDTIDWLVKNVPESNGRVGMLGSSYEGFTVVMALINPHPALKVAAPMSPMVDGWMGDDWFHYGAFRQINFDYFTGQTTAKGKAPTSCARRMTITTTSFALARPETSQKLQLSTSFPGGARSPSILLMTRSGRRRRWTESWLHNR